MSDTHAAAAAPGSAGAGHEESAHLHVHIVSPRVLLSVWGALILGTALTYAATWIDLGAGNLWLAMAIATAKAVCVALFFMHLKWDRPFLGFLFLVAILCVFLFVGIALLDTQAYRPDLIPDYAPGIAPPG
jgi:cytochrome c oxidase subunit 4